MTPAQLKLYYQAIVRMCANEADRAELEVGGEVYRLRMLAKDPGGHTPMGYRILKLWDHDPPEPPLEPQRHERETEEIERLKAEQRERECAKAERAANHKRRWPDDYEPTPADVLINGKHCKLWWPKS